MSIAKAIEKIAAEMELQHRLELDGMSVVEFPRGKPAIPIPPTTLAQYAYRLRLVLLTAENDEVQERVSMKKHKEAIINHLTLTRASTRKEILRVTGIPSGSLSELLSEPEFESIKRGEWRLKGE